MLWINKRCKTNLNFSFSVNYELGKAPLYIFCTKDARLNFFKLFQNLFHLLTACSWRYIHKGWAFGPLTLIIKVRKVKLAGSISTSIFENILNLTPRLSANCLIFASLSGSLPRNWLQGKARIVKPTASEYLLNKNLQNHPQVCLLLVKLHQLFIVWHCQPSVGVNIDYQNNPPSKWRHFHHPPLKQHISCQICSKVGLHQYPLQWSRRRCCSSACCFLLSVWVTNGLSEFKFLYMDATYVWV